MKTFPSGPFLRCEPPGIVGSGYAVKSLEAALWAFAKARNFEEGRLLAASPGDDADTTAAIYEQIAGAHWSLGGIPEHRRRRLAYTPLILGLQELDDGDDDPDGGNNGSGDGAGLYP